MPTVAKPKQKNRKSAVAGDLDRVIIFEWAVLALLSVFLVFEIISARALSKNLETGMALPALAGQPVIVESINYHGHQLPEDFPKILLRGQVGGLISSQEFREASAGSLKYVSYLSSWPAGELLAFYKSYLDGRAYQVAYSGEASSADGLFAQRSSMSYIVSAKPAGDGSVVGITYRALKSEK